MSLARAVAGSAVAIAIAAGCGLDPSLRPAVSAPTGTGSATPASAAAGATATGASPSPIPSPDRASDAGLATAPDPALIASVLDPDEPGLAFQYDADTTARVAGDAGLSLDASALSIGLYTVAGQQPVADYAIVSVLRLRDPGSAGDDWFRSYRDSYDRSACAQAGGVVRHAQTEIATRPVFIGSCAGGAFTYHLRTTSGAIVLSITSVGPGRLGERLAGAVRDP